MKTLYGIRYMSTKKKASRLRIGTGNFHLDPGLSLCRSTAVGVDIRRAEGWSSRHGIPSLLPKRSEREAIEKCVANGQLVEGLLEEASDDEWYEYR